MITIRSAVAGALGFAAAMTLATYASAQSTYTYGPPGPEQMAAMAASPNVSLPDSVLAAAGAYRHYVQRVAGAPSVFRDGDGVAASVREASAFDARQLTRGAVAYAAVVALQDREYYRGVRKLAADPVHRKELAAELLRDPTFATTLPGAESAAGQILAAVGEEGRRLSEAGERVRMAAYDVQRQPWSKLEVADRDRRLADAKMLSSTPFPTSPGEMIRLRDAVSGVSPLGLASAAPAQSYAPVVVRGLALAALAFLGEAGEDDAPSLERLLVEPECDQCLKMAKLNLFQCLAVAVPWYEDVFCLGQHGLKDTGDCLARSSREPRRTYALAAVAVPPPTTPSASWRAEPAAAISAPPPADALTRWRTESGWARY